MDPYGFIRQAKTLIQNDREVWISESCPHAFLGEFQTNNIDPRDSDFSARQAYDIELKANDPVSEYQRLKFGPELP